MKVLMYSGGMDSFLIKELYKPDVSIYVDINSSYSAAEIANLPKDVKVIDGLNLRAYERPDFIIPYRNVYLVLQTLNYIESINPIESPNSDLDIEICIGATAGDRVLDKSYEFANNLSMFLTYLSQGQHWTGGRTRLVSVVMPYKSYTKRQLLEEYKSVGGNLSQAFARSFSCYNPSETGLECWECKPCIRKVVAFTLAGEIEDYYSTSLETFSTSKYAIRRVRAAIKRDILPQIEAGTYGRGEKEEEEILEFMRLTRD